MTDMRNQSADEYAATVVIAGGVITAGQGSTGLSGEPLRLAQCDDDRHDERADAGHGDGAAGELGAS